VYGERGVSTNIRLNMSYTVYSILFGCSLFSGTLLYKKNNMKSKINVKAIAVQIRESDDEFSCGNSDYEIAAPGALIVDCLYGINNEDSDCEYVPVNSSPTKAEQVTEISCAENVKEVDEKMQECEQKLMALSVQNSQENTRRTNSKKGPRSSIKRKPKKEAVHLDEDPARKKKPGDEAKESLSRELKSLQHQVKLSLFFVLFKLLYY